MSRLGEPLLGYALIAPVFALILTFSGYQLIRLIAISFTNERVGMAPGSEQFVGLQNYDFIVHWPDFPRMVENTLVLTGAAVSFDLLVGMLAALALNAIGRGRSALSAILLLPWVIPGIAAAFLWRSIFDADRGVVNEVLVDRLHLVADHIAFLASPVFAMPAIIFVVVWRGAPFAMILFLGALQAVPADLYEAARADGANGWQRWRHITLPQVQRIATIVAILSTVWTLEDYTTPYSLTLGGPANSTNVVAILTFFLGSRQLQTAEAATVLALFLPIVTALIVLLLRFVPPRDKEV